MKKSNRLLLVLSLSGFALNFVTACGNVATNSDQLRTSNSTITSAYGSNSNPYATQAEQCSANPNLVANSYSSSLSSEYYACSSPTTAANLRIFPADGTSKTVCVFPAQVNNGLTSMFVINPYATPINRYAYQCTTIQSTGTDISFSGLSYNTAYVVSPNDAQTFANCIASGSLSTCTAAGVVFSYGQFR